MESMDVLLEMQRENRDNHADLVNKVDTGFAQVTSALTVHTREDDSRFAKLDLQLQPLQQTHNTIKWARRTVYAAAAMALFDGIGHLFGYFKGMRL